MEIELENVLKFDYFNEKMGYLITISNKFSDILTQFRALDVINDDIYEELLPIYTKIWVDIMSQNINIAYKYNNLMDEIFDFYAEDDSRKKIETYINDEKINNFKEDMSLYEGSMLEYETLLIDSLSDLSYYKFFIIDNALLQHLEKEFSILENEIIAYQERIGTLDEYLEFGGWM